ncbi:hypothetical protein G9A89_020577 [Geosiphon pyriformis]|nr:hypothetical protein G9A89_020577 [Geosiphon pyriformis]
MKPTLQVFLELNDRFAALEHSLASFAKCVNKLAKRLDSPEPTVSQLSSGCQPLVTPSSQNQGANIVISKGSGVATSGRTIVGAAVFDSLVVSKIEKTLKNLLIIVMGLSAKMDNTGLKDVVCWHVRSGNMVFIVMETKLRSSIRPWIMNKFDEVKIFSLSLDKKFLGAGVVIIMNNFLVHYVSKVEKVLGCLISVWLLFKGKLLVTVLGLYAGVLSRTRFGQAMEINSFIAKALNSNTFVVLGGDFNENDSKKSASFRFFAGQNVVSVSDYFDTNHKAVIVLISLGGLLDVHLNSLHKQANKDCWKFRIADANSSKWASFKECASVKFSSMSDEFSAACAGENVDSLWSLLSKAVETTTIKRVIDRRMKNFCLDKGRMIRSILDKPFHKVVLDYLVVNNELVLDPGEIKSKYAPLQHVDNNAFSDVMNVIGFDEFFQVVKHLPNGKAAGFSSILNELWKHCSKAILKGLLVLLNLCLKLDIVPVLWKRAWVSMISKPYDWDSALTNTHPIALIETACKIFSKILSDQIFLACSKFGVLHEDNFSVLRGTLIQSPIFVVELVVKDALEKDKGRWDALVKKSFKLKAGLSCNFPNKVLYHFLLYGLKTFEQVQTERKSASVISFSNASEILGPIEFTTVSSKAIHWSFQQFFGWDSVNIFESSLYYDQVSFLKRFGVAFYSRLADILALKKTGSQGICAFLVCLASSSGVSLVDVNDVLLSSQFSDSNFISVFMDSSLKGLGSVDVAGGAAAFFPEIGFGVSVKVVGLLSSMMTKLQTVALVLECVSSFCSVKVCLNSQAALDACISELNMGCSDFCNCCWIERRHIANLIKCKNISIIWVKVKRHFGVLDNVSADALTDTSVHLLLLLPTGVCKHFLMTNDIPISAKILLVTVVRKRLYDKYYPGVLCLHCGKVEFSDHVFTCNKESVSYKEILFECVAGWKSIAGSCLQIPSTVLVSLFSCVFNIGLYALLCKSFVLVRWFEKVLQIFEDCREAACILVDFVYSIGIHHRSVLWEFRSRFRADMEKDSLVSDSEVLPVVSCGAVRDLSDGVVRLIGIDDFFGISFGFFRLTGHM